jgi:hypothetical protein
MRNAYWCAVLTTGKKISGIDKRWMSTQEIMQHPEHLMERPIDWTLDILSTGDILKIKELQLFYPGLLRHAKLKITESGTAFQFCRQVKGFDPSSGEGFDRVEAQVIGRVFDKENGLCQGYIWDRVQGLMDYTDVSIYDFPSWRKGLPAPGALCLDVLGVRL